MTHKLSTALALVLALGAPVAIAQDSTLTNGANADASNETTTDASTSRANADSNAATTTDSSATTGTSTTTTIDGTAPAVDAPGTNATTDAGASASIDLTVEQETQIRTVVTEVQAEPVVAADLDFDVTIGVAVPQTVLLKRLPVRVIEIVPDYEGFLFFILDDGRLVIVDPDTLQIVLIINA